MSWSDLTVDKRNEIYQRRYVSGEDVSELAVEFDMNPITLNRRLQEMRRSQGGPVVGGQVAEKEGIEIFYPDKNRMDVSSFGRIRSLDDLVEACKIDLEVWEVEHWGSSTHEGYRSNKRRQISWADGRIQEGYIEDDGGFNTVTLWQIKASFVRKHPIAIRPVISPVSFPGQSSWFEGRDNRPVYQKVSASLVIPDMQIGFHRNLATGKLTPMHDRKAMDIVLQVAKQTRFNNIVLLGDGIDLPDWSDKFFSGPELHQVTQPAIEELAWFLWQLRQLQPDSRIAYIEGNHEKRLRDAIIRHIPQAYGIKPAGKKIDYSVWSLPYLLGFSDLQVTWGGDYPDGVVWLENDLCVVHGTGLSADKVVNQSDVNVIFGHIHRAELASREIYAGSGSKNIFAFCPGFLGRLDGVIPGTKKRQRWSQGFAVVYHDPGMEHQILHIPIRDGRAIYLGQPLRGQDYVKTMAREVPGDWNF